MPKIAQILISHSVHERPCERGNPSPGCALHRSVTLHARPLRKIDTRGTPGVRSSEKPAELLRTRHAQFVCSNSSERLFVRRVRRVKIIERPARASLALVLINLRGIVDIRTRDQNRRCERVINASRSLRRHLFHVSRCILIYVRSLSPLRSVLREGTAVFQIRGYYFARWQLLALSSRPSSLGGECDRVPRCARNGGKLEQLDLVRDRNERRDIPRILKDFLFYYDYFLAFYL